MTSKIAIIITAAGSSTRMGSSVKKEYLSYNNGTVLSGSAKTFLNLLLQKYEITDFIITCPVGGKAECEKALLCDKDFSKMTSKVVRMFPTIVEGSSTRQKSVLKGLEAVKNNPDVVLIHDGARPFVTEKIILDTIQSALEFGAAVPGLTPVDTQKEMDENGFIIRHLQRSSLCAVQTPQGFNYSKLLEAHLKAAEDNKEYTDDTEIWGNYCGSVKVVDGDIKNIKITYKEDLEKLKND